MIKRLIIIIGATALSCSAQEPAIGPMGGGVSQFIFQNGNGFIGTVTTPRTKPTLSLQYTLAPQPKAPVNAATTGSNITLSGLQTIDGYSVNNADRVLVKDQTSASQNGIYTAAAGAWTRSSDDNTGDAMLNATCVVLSGTLNPGTTWQCNNPAPIILGTTSITFVQTGPNTGQFARGAGTLGVASVNNYAIAQHTHAITSSANPGAAASIVATDNNGYLQLVRLGIGVTPTQPLHVGGNVLIDNLTANLYLKDISTGLQSAATTVVTPQFGNSVRNTSFASGIRGWNVSDAGDAEFNNVLVRGELRAAVFRINEIAATAGTFGVFYSAAKVVNDFTTPASTGVAFNFNAKNSDAGGMLFQINDIVRFKTWTGVVLADAWATVTARTNNGATTTYTATLSAGSTSALIPAGSGGVDYGPSGTGFITLSADGTVGSTPNLTMATHSGSPWSSQTLLLRLGNLNGSYGYASDVYGLGIGSYGVPSESWQTYDTTNGIRIGNNVSTIAQWDTSGGITLGKVAAASPNITIDTTNGFLVRNNTTVLGQWDTAGGIRIGQVAPGTTALTIDSTNGLLVSKYLTTLTQIDTGGGIRFGQVAPSSPNITIDTTNGILIRNNTTNLIQLDVSGNATFGQVATNISNLYWNNSNKHLEFRGGTNGTVVQNYLQTDGSFITGDGNVSLNNTGLAITSSASLYGINFNTGATHNGRILNSTTSSIGTGTQTYVSGEGTYNTGNSELVVAALNSSGGNAELWLYGRGNGLSSPRSYAIFMAPGAFLDGVTIGSATLGSSNPPTHMLDVYGKGWFQDNIIEDTPTGIPGTATSAGVKGTIVWDASFVYVCTATNTWRRAAISSW